MIQTITSNETFWRNAVIQILDFTKLNKTRIRFKVQLKNSTKSVAPKWADVLKAENAEAFSALVKKQLTSPKSENQEQETALS
ncbi:hypothetical protein NIES2109_61840 (plasmid) [Nostoc sp. HK-01]|nr:hypothetical protein NIES2109_61840 [Nostoc sp. HK-01]